MTADLTIPIPASAAPRYRDCGAVLVLMEPLGAYEWIGEFTEDGILVRHDYEFERWRRIPFPVHPGGVIGFKEPWIRYQAILNVKRTDGRSYTEISDGAIAFEADGHSSINDLRDHLRMLMGDAVVAIEAEGNAWRPADELPDWAIRIHRAVTSIAPVLGRELTEEQCEQLGFKGWYLPLHPDIGSTDGRTSHEEMIEAWNAEHPESPWNPDAHYWIIELETPL